MNRAVLVVISFLAGLLLIPVVAFLYLTYGKPPVATTDAPFPFEAKIVKVPLRARIKSEMPASAPIAINEEVLTHGAEIYQRECAFCHGYPGKPSATGKTMYPSTPQLWAKHKNGVVGVSDDPVGETYWRVKNGIRLTGMPAYQKILSENDMWQVSLLLSAADKPLPAAASAFLKP